MGNLVRRCGCLLPFYYRPAGIPLCDALSLPCAKRFSAEFDRNKCDCPLSCHYQNVLIETNTYQTSSTVEPIDSFYHGLNLSGVTVVRVFLKSHETKTFYRKPIYNFVDLFSQLGGVFNVFFGCSILSILELLQLAWYANKSRTAQNGSRKKKFFSVCCRRRVRGVGKKKIKRVNTFFKKCNKVVYTH
ncbi:sodium channel protein Nach-like [Cydia pomonella]|uniref:sodium channel protein Nach-like n=1 Tax=Cydia pomonella TaxID=82600 RepID=UPI002ADDD435|nr:sodium channel protein Nach-like [Cydia pomonella]